MKSVGVIVKEKEIKMKSFALNEFVHQMLFTSDSSNIREISVLLAVA